MAAGLLIAVTLSAAQPTAAGAATREPPRLAFTAGSPFAAQAPPPAPRLSVRAARGRASAAAEPAIHAGAYGAEEVARVRAVLRSLAHGPELAELNVEILTAAELRRACGDTVVACYAPAELTMYVWGEHRPAAGVPPDFAIAHEYGHHIVASRRGEPGSPLAGTSRWATYERVCQLTRRHRVFPRAGPDRYWDDPEEAFAQAYAHLNRPAAGLSWQYSGLLRPGVASLTKIYADVTRPRRGPVIRSWAGAVGPGPGPGAVRGRLAVGAGAAAGAPGPVARRSVRTPLDGTVSVSVEAGEGAGVRARLLERRGGRVLARATAPAGGSATLSHDNCGSPGLRLEIRAAGGEPATFRTEIAAP